MTPTTPTLAALLAAPQTNLAQLAAVLTTYHASTRHEHWCFLCSREWPRAEGGCEAGHFAPCPPCAARLEERA